MNNILVDSCFWFALYEPKDEHHEKALELFEYLDIGNVILPFPTLYETLNTRFSKNRSIDEFEKLIERLDTTIIHDDIYKNDALRLIFEPNFKKRNLSLVDIIIRLMLDDVNLKIDYIITFNTGDFIDVCRRKNIELINS